MAIGYKQQPQASVTLPPVGAQYTFIDSTDGRLKRKDSAGTVVDIEAADAGMTELTGDVLASGVGSVSTVVTSAAVLGKALTGLVEKYGKVISSDTLINALSKLANNSAMHAILISEDIVIPADHVMIRGETKLANGKTISVGSGSTLKII